MKLGILKKPRLGTIEKYIKKRNKNLLNKSIWLFLIITFYLLFYLFFWKDKILFTPDFGQSDAFHINFSYKYFLAENFKKNHFPFWTEYLHNGLPLLGESQSGLLYLINMLFLKFLPFFTAYSLLFITAFLITSIGFFLLLDELKLQKKISFILSLSLPFTFPFSLRWVHLNAIQSYSLIPLLLFFSIHYFNNPHKKKYLIAIAFTCQQIIFAGNTNASFISLFTAATFLSFFILFNKNFKKNLKAYLLLTLAYILGFLISLPSIIPTYQFAKFVKKLNTVDYNYAVSFPYTPKNIPEFIFPFINGNPKLGTYPKFDPASWSTFWENGTYIGFILGILTILILFYKTITFEITKEKYTLIAITSSLTLFLLALGKFSPLYFVFNFPPFIFFRTPGRYLVGTIITLLLFFATSIKNIKKKSITWAIFILLSINLIELLYISLNYHLFVSKKELNLNPASLQYIKKNSKTIVTNIEKEWNKVFLKNGWKSNEEKKAYLFLKNSLYPNSNLIYEIQNIYINTGGLKNNRLTLVKKLIEQSIENKDCKTLSKLLNLFNIHYLINNSEIRCEEIHLAKKMSYKYLNSELNIYIYENKIYEGFFYIPKKFITVKYLEDFLDLLENTDAKKNIAFIEAKNTNQENNLKIDYVIKSKNSIIFKVKENTQGVLILDELIFPKEWTVYLDNKPTPFYKANLIQTAIFIPKGTKKVTIQYNPIYFKQGLTYSLISLVLGLILIKIIPKVF